MAQNKMTLKEVHAVGVDELNTYLESLGQEVRASDRRNEDLIATVEGREITYRVCAKSDNNESAFPLQNMIEDLNVDYLVFVSGIRFTIRKLYIMPVGEVRSKMDVTANDNWSKYIRFEKYMGSRVKTW